MRGEVALRAMRLATFVRRWLVANRGVAAVEFALVLPVILVLYCGGYELSRALTTYRKLNDMTAQLSSVVSQSPASISKAELQSQMNAAALIMNPYNNPGMVVTVTEIQTDPNCTISTPTAGNYCNATVLWSVSSSGAPDALKGTSWTSKLPYQLGLPATGYTLIQTSYPYQTSLGSLYLGPSLPMSDQLYMSPRQETVITCSDC